MKMPADHHFRLVPIVSFLGLLLVLAPVPASAQEKTLLRWKFAQGQKLNVSVDQKTEMETTAGVRPRKMSMDSLMELAWEVDEVDAQGAARITQTITRLRMRIETAGAPAAEFDTASDKQPEGASQYFAAAARLVGVKLQVTMTARGEIQSVTLSDEAKKLLGEALAGTALESLFSSAGLAETLKQTAAVLPEQPVAAGDTWQTESAAKLAIGGLRQQTTYTFEGPREVDGRTLDAIGLSSTLELGKPPAETEHPVTIKEQEHTGTLLLDAAAGRFVQSKVTQKLLTESPYRGTQVSVYALTTLTTSYRPVE